MHTNYLIIGGSHAGLSAIDAIRRCDSEAALTLVTTEKRPPYSPTALPYIISGKTEPAKTDIIPSNYFKDLDVNYINGASATQIDTQINQVRLNNGGTIDYEKLLVATGASALVPNIAGIEDVEFSCIRTMADAEKIKKEMAQAKSALIIGAGFIGMHAAENLANSGLSVTVVETFDYIMPASFDIESSDLIRKAFVEKGITILTGKQVSKVYKSGDQTVLSLADGDEISGDMLVIAAGIKPNTDFLADSGINCDHGIVVDERMRTCVPNVWAAGDVACASDFFSPMKTIGGTIPCATAQGKIAGMDMSQDSYVKDYPGNLNMNTFGFFGNFAFSIGNVADTFPDSKLEFEIQTDPEKKSFCKFVFDGPVLTGVSAINRRLDPGILKELILRKTDLSTKKEDFIKTPLETGRQVMRELF
ncbi:NADH-dependent phenylglyoxylate dehydrogenase subunit epsilon [Desulfobacula toluolica]|uniref:PadH2: phenylglyoxylate:acceptor oxidoreductase, subunit H n=1 Tax=Desulfobacula toluolica (strain DSM 7467 / Tol2) TaxID=651182 RepID=K0NL60_DESTT|nr:NAD(P)/FAD-dependent oxidoreductase [Desulfobacula toluolica]CCK82316.1 PadH2: phenylglyoxylate:acceptor oxidoreductase, subunit H [Desulfobacula toluolica Tol2]